MKRLNTKQARLDLLTYEFNRLTERGFSKVEYKDLHIFTTLEGGKYLLKIFRGTATNPICYYSYRTLESMNEAIERYKANTDRAEKWKTERKATTGRLTGAAACADAIRKELKEKFNGVKFSVTSSTFSMGDSVDVSWIDGPTVKEVEQLTGKYQQGHFDGMTDMYEYNNRIEGLPQAKYVMESRKMSEPTEKKLIELCEPIFEQCQFNCRDAQNMAYQIFCQTSFPKYAEIKGIEKTGVRCASHASDFYKITFEGDQPEPTNPEPKKDIEMINWDEIAIEVEQANEKASKIEAYEQKKADKVERLKEMADRAKKESNSAYQSARRIGDMIPFGQPILVGHHSESRHRRDLDRINSNMGKSVQLDKKADYYQEKAERIENNNVISSDDPAAIDKLKAKLAGLEQAQQLMKDCNKIIREKTTLPALKIDSLIKLGLTQSQAEKILQPDFMGRIGFADYSLQNNNQNMASVKKRIEQLEKRQTQDIKKIEINGVNIVENPEANRIQIFFDCIPEEKTRTELKKNGFRWTPSLKCWQSYRNRWNFDKAKTIVNSIEYSEV